MVSSFVISSPCRADDVAIADAPLHAVRFVDRNEGWAAGADGVMLHTIDGGAHWEQQPIPTKGRVNSLQFLTPYIGVAAGREEMNGRSGSIGVLLMTRDGGITWNRLAPGVMTGLQAATFFDDRNGIAVGDGSDSARSGMFRTQDGGQTWKTIQGPNGPPWLAMAARDANHVALGGAWGRIGTLTNGEYAIADVDKLGGRNVHAIAMEGDRTIAVGQGGLILVSPDSAGRRYGFADLGLPAPVAAQCDFHGVAMVGSHVWIVGRPGTVIFHSGDAGKTWQIQSTGQNLPLHAVHFLDHKTGWAVGELGVVLATTDGGETWKVLRRGGQRAAVLLVHSTGARVPLDLAAHLGGESGYLVTAITINGPDAWTGSPVLAADAPRLATAMRKSGGAAGEPIDRFGVPEAMQAADRAKLVTHWDQYHAGKSADEMLARLVMALRIWQPEVVVTDFAAASTESILVEATQATFRRAADSSESPEQIQLLRLQPWQARKLYGLWDGPGQPHIVVPTTERSKFLGDSPSDFAGRVSGLLSDQPLAKSRGLRLLASTLPADQGMKSIMDGIMLAPGGTARRMLPEEAAAKPSDQPLREINTLLNLSQSGLPQVGDPGTVLARVGPLLGRLPADRGAAATLALADQFAKSGQWTLARESFALIVEKYPNEPAAVDACRWLVRYLSSSEARRRHDLGQFISVARTDFRQGDQVPTKEKPYVSGSGVRALGDSSTTTETAPISDAAGARRWLQDAIALEPKLSARGPVLAGDPAVQMCLAAAHRQLGNPDAGKTWLRKFLAERAGSTESDPWRDAARMELWLRERSGLPPRPVANCQRTNQRPHLDGKLDESIWKDATPAVIKSDAWSADYATTARFAFDDEYLYVAIECRHPADRAIPPIEKRARDADLAAFDRVDLLLDLDRDFQTYYRFRVDQRGALAEDCWGDSTWNPRWFVAFNGNAEGYTAEIAITLADLTGQPITPGQSWAMNIVRVLPGRGVIGWSQPADVAPKPEGCGAMIFSGAK